MKWFLNWIYMSQDIDKWLGVLNMVMNLRFP